jgi:hypothetical protein
MKSKTFLVLLTVCGLLAMAAYLVSRAGGDRTERTLAAGALLLPDLPVNEVAGLSISGADGDVVLRKSETVWQVENRFGYPADFEKIREFILKIRNLKVGRSFAADDDSRRRLSLFPPDAEGVDPEHRGSRIVLEKADGSAVADLILGAPREASAGTGGQYLMPASGETVYLVDRDFRFLEMAPAEWIVRDLLNIAAADVREVVCLDPESGGERYRIQRPGTGQPPVFAAPDPAGRNVVDSKVNNLFSALENLTISDVADPETEAAELGLDAPVCHEFRLFDGTIYTVCKGETLPDDENRGYLRVSAAYRTPPEPEVAADPEGTGDEIESPEAASGEAEPVEMDAADDTDTAESVQADAADETETTAEAEPEPAEADPSETDLDPVRLAAEAAERNEALSRWTFVVPQWKAGRLEADPEAFFETPEPGESVETDPAEPEGGAS